MPQNRRSRISTHAHADTNAVKEPTPTDANEFAAREKKVRNSRFTWAQNQIQDAYQEYGLTDTFLWVPLYWYLVFQAAWRLPDFHAIPSSSLASVEALMDRLNTSEQDRVGKFHLQLAADKSRGLKAKWKDIGIPMYHWINNAFAREWANHQVGEIKNSIAHVSIVDDNESDDSVVARSKNILSVNELQDDHYVESPEPWYEDDDFGAERQRRERALLWNADLKAYVRADATWLHPGHRVGRPLWEALRAIFDADDFHRVIAENILKVGRIDYSKITRDLESAGFDTSHDTVGRKVKKIIDDLKIVRDSEENQRSKHSTCANDLPEMPTIEIPEEEQALRDKRDEQEFREQPRATLRREKKQATDFHMLPCGLSVRVMPAEEFDKIVGNRLVFATGRNGVSEL